jgi:hypothetical protein
MPTNPNDIGLLDAPLGTNRWFQDVQYSPINLRKPAIRRVFCSSQISGEGRFDLHEEVRAVSVAAGHALHDLDAVVEPSAW